MNIDPQAQSTLDAIAELPLAENSIQGMRKSYLRLIPFAGKPEKIASVEDRFLPGPHGKIPVRIYKPTLEKDLPVIMYFHGGWFSRGDLETHDPTVRALAKACGFTVIAVDYRLAPENPFPYGADDCYAATKWVYENGKELDVDASRMAVVGDSAGATLAAVVAQRARKYKAPKLALQALVYPASDASLNTSSWKQFEKGPVLTLEGAIQAWNWYVPNADDRNNPEASILRARDFQGLAPALVITGENDPLRDEGEAYANAMKKNGVDVTLTRYPGMIHGFFQMAGYIDAGRRAIKQVADALKKALEKS